MKRLIIISSALGILYAWFYFSNPNGKVEKGPISISSIDEIKTSETAVGRTMKVYGRVTASASCPAGGFFVLENEYANIVVLSRTITPIKGKVILATIIPRPMGVLQNQQVRVAALVEYKTLPEGEELIRLGRAISQR